MSSPNVLVVITARGGSKGVPRKNIRHVDGKPLIAYAIEAALGVKDRLHKVVVSTDDQEIADVAKACGAQVPFMRPEELATDKAASLPVIQHAVRAVEEQDNVTIDWSMLIQPTNPLITSGDVSAVLDLIDDQATSIISVVDAGGSHPLKAQKIEDGYIKPYIDEAPEAIRRQDLPPAYKRNGSIYMTRRETLLDEDSIYGARIKPLIMPSDTAIDIDTEFDLELAEFLLQKKRHVA